MHSLLPLILLVAPTTAQLTTSFWAPGWTLPTEKLGYYGSIINVSNNLTTLAYNLDNGTDYTGLGWTDMIGYTATMTISPHHWEESALERKTVCTRDPETGETVCENIVLDETPEDQRKYLIKAWWCSRATSASTSVVGTYTHTYPARASYAADEETVTHVYTYAPPSVAPPDWCSDEGYERVPQSVPSYTEKEEKFATYQLVITEGAEMLEPTQGAGATAESAMPTGTAESAGPSATSSGPPEFTGAAGEMGRGGPLMVGLGAAVAAFFV